jgi:protein tyrosine/serine phosphatase
MVVPPALFGIVQPGVYRSNAPVDENLPFLALLNLRSVLYLSPEVLLKSVVDFFAGDESQRKVKLIEHGLESWRPDPSWTPVCDEFIKTALELILDIKNHPVLVCCTSGILQTAPLVGCLRRLQNWSLTSILDEYRAYAGSKARLVHQQYIESFDVDLVTFPSQLPPWFTDYNREFAQTCFLHVAMPDKKNSRCAQLSSSNRRKKRPQIESH